MSNRANSTLIGAFVVGAIALAVAGALILGGRSFFSRPQTFVMFFDGSVAGLSVGSPVQFRGVSVGGVSDIRVVSGEGQIAVFAELDVDRQKILGSSDASVSPDHLRKGVKDAIADGLRAQLQTQSLVTGQRHVGLDMFPGSPVRLTGREAAVPEIPTVPTTVQQASEQLRGLLTRVQTLPVEELFSGSVEAVTPLAASARQTLDQARAALDELKVALGDTQKLVRQTSEQIGPLATSVIRTTDAARATLDKAQRSLASADGLFTEESPLGYRLAQTLEEVADAARSLRSLTGTLERQPSSLLFGRRRVRDR